MTLKLRYYGDPILRQKAEPITEITKEVIELAYQMIGMMAEHQGIGLAATQVGIPLRLFVSTVYPDKEDGEDSYGEPRVFINPVLHNPSHEMIEMGEGCLSMPGVLAYVWRPAEIDFEAMDLQGNLIKERISGFWARVCMHETDHLNGVLSIDRVKGKARTQLEPLLRRIKKNYSTTS